jgi:hypothetical protein
MSRPSSIALAAGAVALFVAAVEVTQSRRAVADSTTKPQPVSVVNPSVAVSVTNASVPVSAADPSAATLRADAATASFGGSIVGGKTALVVQEANNAQHPFHEGGQVIIPAGETFQMSTTNNVPAGKRAVIETVSVFVAIPVGQNLQHAWITTLSVDFNGNPSNDTTYLIPVPTGVPFNGLQTYKATQALRLYAEPGAPVTLHLERDANTDVASASFFLTGYLVDTP